MSAAGEFKILSVPQDPVVTPVRDVALVLAGCGARDGSEITEAVSLMVALTVEGHRVRMFAPDRRAVDTINHLTGLPALERVDVHRVGHGAEAQGWGRSLLEEAARIARGKVTDLAKLKVHDVDALVFAGGFGVAKNLCTYSRAGASATLDPGVERVIGECVQQQKPVAALCIAPVLLGIFAHQHGLRGVSLTLGTLTPDSALAQHLEAWGVRHQNCTVRQACVDVRHRWVSAPAYMDDAATPADIFASASALVQGLRQLLSARG